MLSALQPVWAGVTRQKLLGAQLVAVVLALLQWRGEDPDFRASVPSSWVLVHFAFWALSALFIVPATLRADDAVARGARPWWAYVRAAAIAVFAALLITAAAACLALGYGRAWFHPQPLQSGALPAMYVKSVMDICFTGGMALLCRVNQHLARQTLVYIEDLQDRRAALERRLTDSRLAVAESQMDPAELLHALADIKCDLERSTPDTDGKLDELVLKLRRAMGRTALAGDPAWVSS